MMRFIPQLPCRCRSPVWWPSPAGLRCQQLQREPELAIQTPGFDTYHRQGASQYYRERLLPLY